MATLFARLRLSRSVTDPVGLTVAKPFRTNLYGDPADWLVAARAPRSPGYAASASPTPLSSHVNDWMCELGVRCWRRARRRAGLIRAAEGNP